MDLQEKIENRDTELQRAYDALIQKKDEHESQMNWHEREFEWHEKKLIEVEREIENCKRRAAEQGYPNLFED